MYVRNDADGGSQNPDQRTYMKVCPYNRRNLTLPLLSHVETTFLSHAESTESTEFFISNDIEVDPKGFEGV